MPTISPPDDVEIARAKKNDKVAINSVIAKSAPYVLRLCRNWCRPPLDADDVAQDSLVRIAENISTFRSSSAFFSWVYTITYRTFLDVARKHSRRETISKNESFEKLSETQEVSSHFMRDADEDKDAIVALHAALEILDTAHQEVLILIDVAGHSYEEVASDLGIPVGTVRSRLARARLALRKILISSGTFSASGDVLSNEETP